MRLDPTVLHELSYALPRYLKGLTREHVAQILLSLVALPGIVGDTQLLANAVERWRSTPGLAFVDAYLAAVAFRDGCVVYTKNVRELTSQGVPVPDPLPS